MSNPKGLAKRWEVTLSRAIAQSTMVEVDAASQEEALAIAEGMAESITDWDDQDPLGYPEAIDVWEAVK